MNKDAVDASITETPSGAAVLKQQTSPIARAVAAVFLIALNAVSGLLRLREGNSMVLLS